MSMSRPVVLLLAAAACGLMLPAQSAVRASAVEPVIRSGNAAKDNLIKMEKVITTIDFNGTRLEDALKYIQEQTGAEFEYLFKADRGDGLDPEAQITLNDKNLPAMTVLQKVLQKAAPEERDEATWQFLPYGRIQIGRKADLNKFKRVEVYGIQDLLIQVPIYPDVPEVNLQQALQSGGGGRGGGGGGGSGPFQGGTQNRNQNRTPQIIENERRQRADDLIAILTQYAEPTQWISGGGELQNPRYYQGNIIVDAPDYVHRSLVGYSWWPSSSKTSTAGSRRYASLSVDTAIATVANFRTLPVTGGVGGVPGGGP